MVIDVVGTSNRGFIAAEDIAADVILRLFDAGGFRQDKYAWKTAAIREFARNASGTVIRKLIRQHSGKTNQSEHDDIHLFEKDMIVAPEQENVVMAAQARCALANIPRKHRVALETLGDGGNPIDVCDELNIKPWEAIYLIKEARDFVDRVDWN